MVTKDSSRPYTDEDLALAEGIKRIDLGVNLGGSPLASIVRTRSTALSVPIGFYGADLYPSELQNAWQHRRSHLLGGKSAKYRSSPPFRRCRTTVMQLYAKLNELKMMLRPVKGSSDI